VAIVLARRKKSERVARFRFRQVAEETVLLRRAVAVWADSAISALRDARPPLPESLDDRAAEIWEPLLAVADAAGGSWPEQARKAACALDHADMEAESLGVLLLHAIKETFEGLDKEEKNPPPVDLFVGEQQRKIDYILTVDLLVALVDRDAEPWGGWWGTDVERAVEKKTTPRGPAGKLAALLRPFEVQSKNIRTPGGVFKGYLRADFADAFERYVEGDDPGDEAANPASPPPPFHEGRDDATTHWAQGFGASRPASGVDEDATAESFGREGWSRCSESSSADGAGDEKGEGGGTAAGAAGSSRDQSDGAQAAPTERCPKCSSKDWTPPLDGGPGHCDRCGPITLDREPGSDDDIEEGSI
jgi:hypothetical protein